MVGSGLVGSFGLRSVVPWVDCQARCPRLRVWLIGVAKPVAGLLGSGWRLVAPLVADSDRFRKMRVVIWMLSRSACCVAGVVTSRILCR